MSVFRLQEWWSTTQSLRNVAVDGKIVTQSSLTVGDDFTDEAKGIIQAGNAASGEASEGEEFDGNCIVIAPIDNMAHTGNKLVVSSLSGTIRIYAPRRPDYHIEDLLLEERTGKPILQILTGRFLSGSEDIGLAVLHPRELVVYEVIPQSVKDDRPAYYSLTKAYSHELGSDSGHHFTAYNMLAGPFGNVRGRDLIVVQSLDGKLTFFDQSTHSFTRQFAHTILPGPLQYVSKLDAFVTVTYSGVAECYRYSVLASSHDELVVATQSAMGATTINASKEAASIVNKMGLLSVRPTLVEWSQELGEPCREILVGNFSSMQSSRNRGTPSTMANELVFVCEQNLFLVKIDTGRIIQQFRLERGESISASVIPVIPPHPNVPQSLMSSTFSYGGTQACGVPENFIVATQDGMIHVFSEFSLVWAARTNESPVCMAVGSFGEQRGLVASLESNGLISLSFLGTKPPVQVALQASRDVDYDQIDDEHRRLLQIIRESQSTDRESTSQERVVMKAQIPRVFDADFSDIVGGEGSAGDIDFIKFATFREDSMGTIQAALVAARSGGSGLSAITLGSMGWIKATVRVFVTHTNENGMNSPVTLTAHASSHMFVTPASQTFQSIGGLRSTPTMAKFHIFVRRDAEIVSDSSLVVIANYQSHRGEPQASSITVPLPIWLSTKLCAPQKSAQQKFVLDTDGAAIPLPELYADVFLAYQQAGIDPRDMGLTSSATHAIGLRLFSTGDASNDATGPVVTILVSKNAGRYRVQTDRYEHMCLVLKDLEIRLNRVLKPESVSSLGKLSPECISITSTNDPMDVENFFSLVQSHLTLRHDLSSSSLRLDGLATQYRTIQKRLLSRFRDRNPTPLNGLDHLLQETYESIIRFSEEIEMKKLRLLTLGHSIDAYVKMLVQMLGVRLKLTIEERDGLEASFCPNFITTSEIGWEEVATSSLTHLIKNRLGKSSKTPRSNTNSTAYVASNLEIPKKIDTLRKVILSTIDRYDKGLRIFS